MLAAILNGKVSSRADGSEDLLTSVVFGAYERLPLEEGLLAFLRSSVGRTDMPARLLEATEVEVAYWPWWKEDQAKPGAEPDVVLWLGLPGGGRSMVVVEAKRRSGKSGTGAKDQLARQAANGLALAERTGAEFVGIVYLTAHFVPPWTELQESEEAMCAHFGLSTPVPLWWASWRLQREVLKDAGLRSGRGLPWQLARDAALCLDKWGLVWFSGVEQATEFPEYTFERCK